MPMNIEIRTLEITDLNAVKDILNIYVLDGFANFETTPYDDAYMQKWFKQFAPNSRHQAFVAVVDGVVSGITYSQKYREKPAYQSSVETTIYLNKSATGQGVGTKLVLALRKELVKQNVHRAYSVISLPNDASIGLHKSLGYNQIAHLSEVGYKYGKFHDVIWLEYKFS